MAVVAADIAHFRTVPGGALTAGTGFQGQGAGRRRNGFGVPKTLPSAVHTWGCQEASKVARPGRPDAGPGDPEAAASRRIDNLVVGGQEAGQEVPMAAGVDLLAANLSATNMFATKPAGMVLSATNLFATEPMLAMRMAPALVLVHGMSVYQLQWPGEKTSSFARRAQS